MLSMPAELLLDIIPHIPFSPENLSCLCLTCKTLNALIKAHEKSLVSGIQTSQFPPASISLFPDLKPTTFASLSTLHKRLETLESLHEQWLHITSHGPELDWLKGRWQCVHKAGLLLLYRLQDASSYNYQVALLNALPSTSLACLLFKLVSSIRILRIYGPEPIKDTVSAGDLLARSDIELAFEEMLLQHGPDFFVALLKVGPDTRKDWAVAALKTEIAGMIERQMPTPEGIPKPPTLTSCLRRAFAARLGCHVAENASRMWEVLSSTKFDVVDEGMMRMLVNGEEVKGGMKRMGF